MASYDLRREVVVAKFQVLIDAINALDGNTDEIEAKLDSMITLLTSLDGKDYATETTLLTLETTANAIETLLTSLDGKVATETTLAGIKSQTDLLTFTGGKLDVNATVSLSTNTNNSLVSEVAQSATSVELLAEDLDRISFYVRNDSSNILYIALGATATTLDVIKLLPSDVYFEDKYTGVVSAIWDTAGAGNARVLDISPNATSGLPVTDGLELWLDATDERTLTVDGSNYVSQWVDKSTNAFVITQATASNQAQWQNSKELVFDGVNDFYNIDSVLTPLATTTVGTIAFWVKPTSITGSSESIIAFGDTNSTPLLWVYVNSTSLYVENLGNWRFKADTLPLLAGRWNHVAIVQDGVSPILYIDGVSVAQTFEVTTDKTKYFNGIAFDNGRLACRNFNSGGDTLHFSGSIAEPLIYNTNLSASQISDVYNYSLANYS
jgi:hypothetical protein